MENKGTVRLSESSCTVTSGDIINYNYVNYLTKAIEM